MTTCTVHARKWAGGWELHIDGGGVTQCRTLAKAEDQVRDYLATVHDTDMSHVAVEIIPEIGTLAKDAAQARQATRAAATAQEAAAKEARRVAMQLRAEGLSVSDAAVVLGISRGRVSQLLRRA